MVVVVVKAKVVMVAVVRVTGVEYWDVVSIMVGVMEFMSRVRAVDGFENVFHLLGILTPLDFLSISDHPGVLHLLQPFPYKAAASEEGCFGGVSPKVHVGMVQSILLHE
ncbi:unnamed protein product [Schistocephalus solidus]|uniref:Secreted protein n=1 Tax=Schistocephalus solidus TaxID=70667 RepID=A0A183TU74_SCHSO|nr:unnamed protein product [Schistocephalus solidus]